MINDKNKGTEKSAAFNDVHDDLYAAVAGGFEQPQLTDLVMRTSQDLLEEDIETRRSSMYATYNSFFTPGHERGTLSLDEFSNLVEGYITYLNSLQTSQDAMEVDIQDRVDENLSSSLPTDRLGLDGAAGAAASNETASSSVVAVDSDIDDLSTKMNGLWEKDFFLENLIDQFYAKIPTVTAEYSDVANFRRLIEIMLIQSVVNIHRKKEGLKDAELIKSLEDEYLKQGELAKYLLRHLSSKERTGTPTDDGTEVSLVQINPQAPPKLVRPSGIREPRILGGQPFLTIPHGDMQNNGNGQQISLMSLIGNIREEDLWPISPRGNGSPGNLHHASQGEERAAEKRPASPGVGDVGTGAPQQTGRNVRPKLDEAVSARAAGKRPASPGVGDVGTGAPQQTGRNVRPRLGGVASGFSIVTRSRTPEPTPQRNVRPRLGGAARGVAGNMSTATSVGRDSLYNGSPENHSPPRNQGLASGVLPMTPPRPTSLARKSETPLSSTILQGRGNGEDRTGSSFSSPRL